MSVGAGKTDGMLPSSRYICLSLTSSILIPLNHICILMFAYSPFMLYHISIPIHLSDLCHNTLVSWYSSGLWVSWCVVAILWNMTPNSSIPVSKLWVAQGDGRGGMVIAWGPCGSPGGRWCARLPGQPWWPLPVWHPMCRLLQLSLVFGQPRLCSWWWPQMIGRIMQHCSCAE